MQKLVLLFIFVSSIFWVSCSSKASKEASSNAVEPSKGIVAEQAAKPEATNAETPEVKAQKAQDEQLAPTGAEELTKENSPRGLVIELSNLQPDVEIIDMHGTLDGIYTYEYLYSGMVAIALERLHHVEDGLEEVTLAVRKLEFNSAVRDLKVTSVNLENISYPTYKLTYTTGRNEDTRTCLGYYIQTEDFDFRVQFSTPADYVEEYTAYIDNLVKSINLKENK